MIIKQKIQLLMLLSAASLLTACATNDELFAKYDKSCDLPNKQVKIIEKVKFVDKIKVVEKAKMLTIEGLHWEPAVYFGFDRSRLDEAETQRLRRDLLILKRYPELKVNIQSFTDVKGSSAYNRKLALRREATVVNYLTSMGIPRDRILVSPLGEDLPILGDSVAERSINRRVELMLLDTSGRPMALKVRPQNSDFEAPYPVR